VAEGVVSNRQARVLTDQLSDASIRRPCDTGDMRQPYGPGDIIEIDVIDADPGVFGPSEDPGRERVRRPRPRWLMPVAIAAVGVCGAVAMVWRPWEHPPEWRTFGPAAPATSSLSDHLILDLADASVTTVDEGQDLGADEPTPLGYVFTVPGGTYDYDPWALSHARASNGAREPEVVRSTELVRDLPAKVHRVRVRTTVTWGPIDGLYWDSETNRLDDDDALSFANAVGVDDGSTAVAYSHSMGSLKPLGDVKTLTRVQVLTSRLAGEPVLSKFTPTMVAYLVGDSPVTVASIATDTDALAMARFFLDQGRDTTVHGVPAAVIETRRIGKVVVWHEGDRLVVVAADVPDDQLLAMAETVRPASDEEWDSLQPRIARAVSVTTSSQMAVLPNTIASGTLLDGSTYHVSIELGNPTYICAQIGSATSSRTTCGIFDTSKSPSTYVLRDDLSGAEFVAGVVPDEGQFLRVTATTDGTIVDIRPSRLDDGTWAAAALLPAKSTFELIEPDNPD